MNQCLSKIFHLQQQRQLEQQRLLEQQQRQLDLMHQEREAARLKQHQDEVSSSVSD